MPAVSIRGELDRFVETTDSCDISCLPSGLVSNLKAWKWGSYGWVSPASLLFTAAWHKYYFPEIDCCKIWAADESNHSIPGGYSIRQEDEIITVPIMAKYDLCAGFCSPNSGMQGSRAIEKMRSYKRLNRDFSNTQRTYFDLKMFASIMNDTNDLNHQQLLELMRYYICIAKSIRSKRIKENEALSQESRNSFDVLKQLSVIRDPELTKCVVASCLAILYAPHHIRVVGVDDNKTAADARAQKPGDLSLISGDQIIGAIEVKDKSQEIDWNNIERAKRILHSNPSVSLFLFVLESRSAAVTQVISEMVRSAQLSDSVGSKISIISLYDLYHLARIITDEATIINTIGKNITVTPGIKPETRKAWIRAIE